MFAEFFVPGEQFEAEVVRQKIEAAGQSLSLAPLHLERIQAAMLRAALNALEYNQHTLRGAQVPICIRVTLEVVPEAYNPEAEGAGSTSSWGYFIVNRLIDKTASLETGAHHMIEVFLYPEGQK